MGGVKSIRLCMGILNRRDGVVESETLVVGSSVSVVRCWG